VDLTLRSQKQSKGLDFAFTIRNLFNADAREPSPYGTPFVPIPNDLPLVPREYRVELNYQL